MMKKMMLMLSAVLGASVMLSGADAKKPAAAPAKEAAPVMKSVTLEELTASLPNVLAKIGGKDITKAQFINDFLRPQLPGGKMPPMPEEQAKEQINQFATMAAPMLVKGYVDQLLLEADAAKAGFKPSAELVTKLFKEQFAKLPAQQKEMLKMQLQIQNKTEDSYIKEQAANVSVQKMAALQAYIEKDIVSKIVISDADIKAYYDKNAKRFTEPADPQDAIRASHILISVKKDASKDELAKAEAKAKALIAEINKAPDTFAAVAARESACPSKAQGGSLGAFRSGEMVPEFEKAAGALKIGTISQTPVKTSFGYHIIRREALNQAKVIPFEKVKPLIANMLKGEKTQQAIQSLIEAAEKANKVEIFVKSAVQVPAAPVKK
ncbi:MAG: peptidylprolyl isomerase [Lentisphaeria bacterium]|nr:peptidylprolyl isomerase [Lentisphaeria bacterium]